MQLLTVLLITPLFGAILIAVLHSGPDRLYRNVALARSITAMVLSFYMLSVFDIHSAGLLLTAHMKLNPRLGSTDIISLGGAARSMPLLSALFLLFGLASMGIPGTSGFPAEFLILYAAITTHTGAVLQRWSA